MNLQINAQANRLIAQGTLDENRVKGQKEGIAIVTGNMAKIQLKLGLAEKVMIDGQEVVINKHSRNKFIARTTKDSGVDTIGRFGKAHKIIDAAIQSSGRTTLDTLSTHVRAQRMGGVEKTDFTKEQETTGLFDREVNVVKTAATTVQKAVRGFQARKARLATAQKAATTIQTAVRGFQARKVLTGLKAQAATAKAQATFEARKASVWGTSMADVVAGKAKTPATALADQENEAARTIQAAFRGFKAIQAAKQEVAGLKAERSQAELQRNVAARSVAPRTFASFAAAIKAPAPVDHAKVAKEKAAAEDAELTRQAEDLKTAILAARIVEHMQSVRSNHLGEIQEFDKSSLRHVTEEDRAQLQEAKEETAAAERMAYIREANAPIMQQIRARKGYNPTLKQFRVLDASTSEKALSSLAGQVGNNIIAVKSTAARVLSAVTLGWL